MNKTSLDSMSFMSNAKSLAEMRDILEQTGKTSGFVFLKDMELTFLPLEEMRIIESSFKNSKGEEIPFYKIPVWVKTANFEGWQPISIGAFNRRLDQTNLQTYLKMSEVVMALLQKCQNHYDRIVFLAGKTIKISKLKEFTITVQKDGKQEERTISLPIFEEVQ